MYEGLVIAYDDPVICKIDLICFFCLPIGKKHLSFFHSQYFSLSLWRHLKSLKTLNSLKLKKNTTAMPEKLIRPSGNYRKLLSYQKKEDKKR